MHICIHYVYLSGENWWWLSTWMNWRSFNLSMSVRVSLIYFTWQGDLSQNTVTDCPEWEEDDCVGKEVPKLATWGTQSLHEEVNALLKSKYLTNHLFFRTSTTFYCPCKIFPCLDADTAGGWEGGGGVLRGPWFMISFAARLVTWVNFFAVMDVGRRLNDHCVVQPRCRWCQTFLYTVTLQKLGVWPHV